MTHLLIPIKDIEERIKEYQELKKFGYSEQDASRSIHELNLILNMNKQISLNEEDIEEKANASFICGSLAPVGSRDRSECELRRHGYIQALTDLL